jgi:hypothetical protein
MYSLFLFILLYALLQDYSFTPKQVILFWSNRACNMVGLAWGFVANVDQINRGNPYGWTGFAAACVLVVLLAYVVLGALDEYKALREERTEREGP